MARQAETRAGSLQRIQAAQVQLADLLSRIDGVRERALKTEQVITEMTADIKRLDGTKKNITLSMTALKRLQMLTTAYEQLRELGKSRQYKECAQLLQAVIQLMAHFKSYRSIEQIATLSRNVSDLQRELLEQVCEDFEMAFTKGEVHAQRNMLAEACLVLDAIGDNARSRLITWYCNTSLREYRQIFRGNDEVGSVPTYLDVYTHRAPQAGSLDNISRRYAWFHRMLKTYDLEHAIVFPAVWRVNELLANAFCEGTRDDFKGILQRSARKADGQTLDVNLLLSCLQETLDFEHALERRFANEASLGISACPFFTNSPKSRLSIDTIASNDEKPHAFKQAISEAFEPYLSLWVEAQDRQLATLLPKYKQAPLRNNDEDFSAQSVISSSTELFQFYRLTLAQCAKLSTGQRLHELSQTFAKYLDQYAQQVLFHSLSDRFGAAGPAVEDIILVLNTADYCYTTTTQLEEKIKQRIDAPLSPSVDLQSQADTFMGITLAAVRALVKKIEAACEPAWREMRNTPWARLDSVGDQSPYIGELTRAIATRTREILALIHKHQYARALTDHIVDALATAFTATIAVAKPISEAGAEQLLLDAHALKQCLAELPSLAPGAPPPTIPATHTRRVATTMSRVDALLKTLQVRASPAEALVQAYLIHVADGNEANFRRVLDLKGISRQKDQAPLVELFNAFRAARPDLPASSAVLAPLAAAGAGSPAPPAPGTAAAQTAAGFGASLLSAARDGVDRLGGGGGGATPAPASDVAGAGPPSRTGSPALGGAEVEAPRNLNENLRGIGKFFRRDMSGFGRFGGRAGEEGR